MRLACSSATQCWTESPRATTQKSIYIFIYILIIYIHTHMYIHMYIYMYTYNTTHLQKRHPVLDRVAARHHTRAERLHHFGAHLRKPSNPE